MPIFGWFCRFLTVLGRSCRLPKKKQNPYNTESPVSESSLFQATVLRDAPRIASPGCRQARDHAEPRKIVLTQDLVPRQPGVQRSPRAKYIKWTPSPAS
ncbi:hypothetical protein FVE85_0510 [Porphyridium purpureum]|uniref:Uncharacterized protein n=1 Tax=Porphyridium purpureum TaxID=35688 RepID=A0A5J4YYU0_PORPP|nr:hypothetical protein FVE85_0510 [Porphyridium purpureum]|eukprot:POR4300..scf208_2